MSEETELAVGQTYVIEDRFTIWNGEKVILTELPSNGVCSVRQSNGLGLRLSAEQLHGPVEALKPGIDALCMLCRGLKEVPITEQDPNQPWIMRTVGHEPCPHCG